ncbi:hypothetical protein DM01DRAFT_1113566 [Hesseltinella vesiculosa]|uniref:COP9 signalosome complex subunit 3 N-terminal helical repeats domain-containing protein n=1 Tax=Hesseltinella vesiculosa TaxID=101127 RepID=A0A1X2GA29_9FUNG|nr:hypothetical protein DM01DRAFT_1113566 [Hesseltinella vesiculosa]
MAPPVDVDTVIGTLLSITSISDLRGHDVCQQLETLNDQQLTSNGCQPLQVLTPSQHSLGYLYFITAACRKADETAAQELYFMLVQFIHGADIDQLKLAGKQMNRISLALEHLAEVQGNPMLVLAPLRTLIERLTDADEPVLTPFHSVLAKHALLSKMYKYPLPILNNYIIEVDPKMYGTSIQDYLEYHYYGAVVFIGNKLFAKAFDFLLLVIAAPQQKAFSAIQLESYKRFILVSLILFGSLKTLPKYVPHVIEKLCRKRHPAYFQLLQAFQDDNMNSLNRTLQTQQQTFSNDGLFGLAKQLKNALYRKRIQNLANVYCKIYLKDVVKSISHRAHPIAAPAAEIMILDMIHKQELRAQLSTVMMNNTPLKLLTFQDSQDAKRDTPKDHATLYARLLATMSANTRLSAMDKSEGLDKGFQTKVQTK